MRRFFYFGDINIEHGGMFYALDTFKDGYADCVRVEPCSDAGGPYNCFWVERLTVVLPKAKSKDWEQALACLGYDTPDMWDDWVKNTETNRRHILVSACVSYGLYDRVEYINGGRYLGCVLVQIGKKQDGYTGDSFKPDVVLRGNASLYEYARRATKDL